MQRYLCIHGHFYQPPRENAWRDSIDPQPSAWPFRDWNDRIAAECYTGNAFCRLRDVTGTTRTLNNYSRISFNFGPTLLSWLSENEPTTYQAILNADRLSQERFSGHGSAMAQVYNHVIMPWANARDQQTQVRWGIRDFEFRFGRRPEGMWLPETAVDFHTLEALVDAGLRFTVLAPHQASRIRLVGDSDFDWIDVRGSIIDPSRAYRAVLPSGRDLALFFYDGPISQAVAFEGLMYEPGRLARRLMEGFHDDRTWPQLVHVASDGETYGHHQRHGDVSLARALDWVEHHTDVILTNYGEFLDRHPPTHEVLILPNTSWSCAHGIERWRSDCGCSGGHPGWTQQWRTPLRTALDSLRDSIAGRFQFAAELLVRVDPWQARDAYIDPVLHRSPESWERFLHENAHPGLDPADALLLRRLLEMQRFAMLMYTSCGWFFDDVSGIETIQILQYAARVVELAEQCFPGFHLGEFMYHLDQAESNIPSHGTARIIFERLLAAAQQPESSPGSEHRIPGAD